MAGRIPGAKPLAETKLSNFARRNNLNMNRNTKKMPLNVVCNMWTILFRANKLKNQNHYIYSLFFVSQQDFSLWENTYVLSSAIVFGLTKAQWENSSCSLFPIYDWVTSPPMRENVTFVTSSLIGGDVAHQLIDADRGHRLLATSAVQCGRYVARWPRVGMLRTAARTWNQCRGGDGALLCSRNRHQRRIQPYHPYLFNILLAARKILTLYFD